MRCSRNATRRSTTPRASSTCPLGAHEVQVTALFKLQADGTCRVSLRSKPAVDVRSVAERWQGGGHKNAAGCTLAGDLAELRPQLMAALVAAIDASAA